MTHLTKPWKHMNRYHWKSNESDMLLLSQKLTKMFAFKVISKIIYSQKYLDLVIKFKSGESLIFKEYYCPSCAENQYNQDLLQKAYEDKFLGITCKFILIHKTVFYPNSIENVEAYWANIISFDNQNNDVCGFLGNVYCHPRSSN
ncbi:MAG: hypothetical protein ACRYGR_01835 [Janthinobacterium lividum]